MKEKRDKYETVPFPKVRQPIVDALHLQKTAEAVQSAMPKQYAAEVERCQAAGKPLIEKDANTVQNYLNELDAIAAAASKDGTGDIETIPADKGEPVLVG